MTEALKRLAAIGLCAAGLLLWPYACAETTSDVEIASSAKAAILIEQETGQVLFAHNTREALPMASTTKVMTALIALERGHLDDVVTVGKNAYGVPGTSIYLNLGETITLRDLLYGLMLASGNDAAVAIAEHIGGDVETFCGMMTQRATELGCRDTVFATPHGLPHDHHHTTAEDLALIAREAMTQPVFRQIVSTRRASIPWEGREYNRVLNNKNRLLASYDGATGIKTGYTRAAGRCLVFGARRDGLEIVGVVLNCGNMFEEAARLMDLGFAQYERFEAFASGETVRVLPVVNATQETVCVQCADTLAAPVRKGVIPTLELDLPETASAGLRRGDTIGVARLMEDGKVLDEEALVVGETLAARDYGYELERVMRNWSLQPLAMAE